MQSDPRHCKGKAGQVYVQQSKGMAGCRDAKAKYSQAETSEGIARKRSATAGQGET